MVNRIVIFILLGVLLQPVVAADAEYRVIEPDDQWEVVVAPHIWLSGVSGSLFVQTTQIDVDLKPNELARFAEEFDIIAQLHMELKKGRWSFVVDPSYLKITYEPPGVAPLPMVVPISVAIIDTGVYYDLVQNKRIGDSTRSSAVSVFGGVRYFSLRFTTHSPVNLLNIRCEQAWYDPIIGLRMYKQFNKYWKFWWRGDIGGFGIPGSSKFSWHTMAMASFSFNPHAAIDFGFRALNVDYSTGSGRDEFKADVTLYGPVVGLGFSW